MGVLDILGDAAAALQATGMLPDQVNMESGGRQFDDSGKPLVGRHRDGSTPPPSKRAYGVAQMQVGTGQNVAKAHGIAWDENKFMNDPKYNRSLGDAHMNDLRAKYGDENMARAAYHSGEGTVDRGIQKFGAQGFWQALGPEGRAYIGKGTGMTATNDKGVPYTQTGPGRGVANPMAFLADLHSTIAPETKSSQNVGISADKIFGAGPELAARGEAVDQATKNLGTGIDVLDAATQAVHAQQLTSAVQQIGDTRVISDQIVQGTDELKKQVMPVFQARQRVADQLDKINTMNPLVAGLKGVFDLNYDRDHLESQLKHFDTTLQARAHDFDYINNLHNVALQEVDRRYKLDTALPDLHLTQANQDYAVLGMRLQQTAGLLSSMKDGVATQAQLISSQAMARNDLMNRLDDPTIADLMGKAQAAGGNVDYNGATFSYHELHDMAEKRDQQDLQTKMYRVATASGQIDLADKIGTNIARSLTKPQAEAAIAANGVWTSPTGEKIQLPQDVLTQSYSSLLQRETMQATDVANNLPAASVLRVASDAVGHDVGLFNRGSQLFGPQESAGAESLLTSQRDLTHQLVQAYKAGQPQAVLNGLASKIAANSAAFAQHVDGAIMRSVGGDAKAAGYVKSFIYGTPMNAGAATEAMTYFALKGGLPTGLGLSSEARQVFDMASASVKQHQGEIENGKPITAARLQQMVTAETKDAAANILGQSRFDRTYSSLPQLAKSAGNPLGAINPQAWTHITTTAQADAATMMAHTLNTTPENVLKMYATHRPINDTPEAKAMFANFTKNHGTFDAAEIQSTIRYIDELPQVKPGVPNSTVLHTFLRSPELSSMASQYTQSLGNNSIGDYLVNPMGAGMLESTLASHGAAVVQAQSVSQAEDRAAGRRATAIYGHNPSARLNVILGTIPEVGPVGAKILMPFVNQVLQQPDVHEPGQEVFNVLDKIPGMSQNNVPMNRAQEQKVLTALQRTKFQDPQMELYRKKAIAGFEGSSTQAQSFMQILLDGLNPL